MRVGVATRRRPVRLFNRTASGDGDPAIGAPDQQPPGQAHRPLTAPAGDQRVQRRRRAGGSGPGGGAGGEGQRRQTRVRTRRGRAASSRRPSSGAGAERRPPRPGEACVEPVGVLAEQVGGAGQGRGDPGAELGLQLGQQRAAPGPGRRPGPRCAGPPTASSPSAAQAASVVCPRRRRAAAGGTGRGGAAYRRASGRRSPGPGPAAPVSAWSSRVCPSSTMRGAVPRRRPARAPRSGPSRAAASGPSRLPAHARPATTSTGSQAQVAARLRPRARGDLGRTRPAARGRRRPRRPAGRPRGASKAVGGRQGQGVGAPAAGDQRRSRLVRAVAASASDRRTASPAAADGRVRPGHRAHVRRRRGSAVDPGDPGRRVLDLGRQRQGLSGRSRPR